MPDAFEGFLSEECDDYFAGLLRGAAAALPERGYAHLEFNLFDVELFFAERKAAVAAVVDLGYSDVELPLDDFLAALPDVTPIPAEPRKTPIVLPPLDGNAK